MLQPLKLNRIALLSGACMCACVQQLAVGELRKHEQERMLEGLIEAYNG